MTSPLVNCIVSYAVG